MAEVEAKVVKQLPNQIFELELSSGRRIRAHLGTEMKMKYTRLLAGEIVMVEVSPYDSGRGRITERVG
ncbi:MAG: translation initiation factor IF-1 [Candidatus Omnitrophica bacterium]|nr:translation initiation factor IF-1 [Candidatus Omnitrophota bacterium]MCA9416495.1 translation initiation factor IF-1 [Candidatus Omnitrophota bacterium]MCA9425080.1 translation initiation factor IF-1 [Candidatus Omnitrophota bacterium]MCA9435640.1 translation initiation factor IF-1 [Candidatus Omnitrophota bacterium]MCA9440633.1 translation initiation factor IF-1 [Candidatus Omnitrophota bacterium]